MVTDLLTERASLKSLARKKGAEAREIAPDDIVVSQWVRFRCRYGCRVTGHHGCPPYAPSPNDTLRMVDEYTIGLLLWFEGGAGPRGIRTGGYSG